MSWVPLHVHSQYSILSATASVKEIAKKSSEFGMKSVALTDNGNLFGVVDFYKACQSQGVKPIIGCELYEAPFARDKKKRTPGIPNFFPIVLLAKNQEGYKNLCKLTSIGFLEGFYYKPRIDQEILKKYSSGLICLSGGDRSRVSYHIEQGKEEETTKQIQWYKEVFGEDYFLELQRHSMSDEALQNDGMFEESWLTQKYRDYVEKQEKRNNYLIECSKKYNISLVATNDSYYIDQSDWKNHEIQQNVQSGDPCEIWEKDSQGNLKFRVPNPKRHTFPSHEFYFKSIEQMQQLFSDQPEALEATLKIADLCNVEIDFETKHYPVFTPPELENVEGLSEEEKKKAVDDYLWNLCREGIKQRYTPDRLEKVKEFYPDQDPLKVIEDRLNLEMGVIAPKGMCDYLLIVWDFIHWAKKQSIPVGPGRGSGAGSIVLYLIGITDIEPLRFNLFFERFINPERLSYPDIDVDICMERRGEVIAYMLEKYGRDNVAQIITFNTMKAKSAIKDVGRALSVPFAKLNAIAKLIPEELNITIEKALDTDVDLLNLYQKDSEVREVIDLGKKLEGSIRNTGIHAAGVVVCGDPLTNHIPLCLAKDSDLAATQYSMKPVEGVGMLKIDFLGLKTLTSINICVDYIRKNTEKEVDWMNLPLDNKEAFLLINQGKTSGVFQMESTGMQDLARQLHLDKFEEIIAVLSLYRPGPMDMIPSFINRKHGREPIEYDHPWMEEILSETYGIMVYQEQVMQIAQKLANYSLGEGDVLRRAMGKKDKEQMETQREKFRLGAMKNDISEERALSIFDQMEKFASYGFNKSHAAAYGYLTYVTAFLKANYPKEWMASLMSCDRDDLTKVGKWIQEAQGMKISILEPDINEAGEAFTPLKEGIRFGLAGIKGVGIGIVEAIIAEREKKGAFTSLYEFLKRVNIKKDKTSVKKIGKKLVENLVDSGSFDYTGWSRDALKESIDPMHDVAVKSQKDFDSGFLSLFGDEGETRFQNPPKVKVTRTKQELLFKEKELLGFFLSGHPMGIYQKTLRALSCVSFSKIPQMSHDTLFRTAFIVDKVQVRVATKSQRKFAILVISDGVEHFELPIWPELYEEKSSLLVENQMVYAIIQVKKTEDLKLSCLWFDDLTKANQKMIECCDQEYDKAQLQVQRYANMKRKEKKQVKNDSPAVTEAIVKPQHYTITLDAELMQMSHVLQLQELILENRGKTALQVLFKMKDRDIATIHVGNNWSIEESEAFNKKIKDLSFTVDAV